MDDEKLSAETLSGDIRDMLLTHIRAMETPWSKLSEDKQREKIYAATEAAKSMVRGAVKLVTAHEFPHIVVETGKWTVKDGVKLEVNALQTVGNIAALAEHGTKGAVLILVDSSVFFGERAPAKPDKDQPDLPIDPDLAEWSDDQPAREPEVGEVVDAGEWADMPGEAHDPVTGELVDADPPADGINTATVVKGGKRKRVTVDELQAELRAGKVRVHGIGDVEVTA